MSMKRRLNALLKRSVEPRLVELGFERSGRIFSAERSDVTWLIDLQSYHRLDGCLEFTINGGVYVPEVFGTYAGNPDFDSRSLPSCCVRARIGMLTEELRDHWWTLDAEDTSGDADTGAGVMGWIEDLLIPFLARFPNQDSIAEFLNEAEAGIRDHLDPRAETIRLSYAAIVHDRLASPERSARSMRHALASAENGPIQDIVESLVRALDVTAEAGGDSPP